MDPGLEPRIQTMFRRDVLVAAILAVVMWVTLIFTLYATIRVIDVALVKTALAVACVILGTFNTLGLLSMARRYKIEREHVYGEDIHHLDANRRARQARRGATEVSAS